MKKNLLLIASAVLTLTACQKTVLDIPDYQGQVSFKSEIAGLTKVAGSSFDSGDEIAVVAVDEQNASSSAKYIYDGSTFISQTPFTKVSEDALLSYTATYPYIDGISEAFSYEIPADQSGDGYAKADLLVAQSEAVADLQPTLKFKHAMSSLLFTVKNLDGEVIEATSASLTSKSYVECDIASGSYLADEYAEEDLVIPAAYGDYGYKAIVAPQTIAAGVEFASFEYAGTWYSASFPADATFASGCQYTYEFVVDAVAGAVYIEQISVSINDWIVGDALPTEPDPGFKVISVTPNSTDITIEIEINNDLCEGVAVYIDKAIWYSQEDFLNQMPSGWIGEDNLLYFSQTVSLCEDGYALTPGTEYKVAFAAFVSDDDEVGQIPTSDVVEYDVTTIPISPGVGNVVDIAIDEETIGYTTVSATLTRESSATTDTYIGVVPTANINGDLDAYVVDNAWFTSAWPISFSQWDNSLYQYVEVDSFTSNQTGLSSGTDYTFFTMACLEDGSYGELNSVEFTTKAIPTNPDIEYTITFEPGYTSTIVTVEFGEGVQAIAFENQKIEGQARTEEQIKASLTSNLINENTSYWILNDGTGVGVGEVKWLTMETDYRFYSMAIDDNGAITEEMKCDEYSTSSIDYSSPATVTLTPTSEVLEGYGYTDFDVELSGGAVGYKYQTLSSWSVTSDTPEGYANYMLTSGWPTDSAEATLSVTLSSSTYSLIVVPYDADGNYGTPVLYAFPWE